MRLPPPINVYFDNNIIPVKNSVKFLGVFLDSKLSGVNHCDYIFNRCERNLNILRCLSGVWWGAHPFCMKLMYNALIRSILDYGTFLLSPGNATRLKKLDNIQSKALRLITGAMKTSPINALQVECVEAPLHLRRQYLSDKFIFRSLQYANHPLRSKLQELSQLLTSSKYWSNKSSPCLIVSFNKFINIQAPTHTLPTYPLFGTNFESLIISPDIRFNIGINKGDSHARITFNYFCEQHCHEYNYIFTDASKHGSSGNVGIGVFHLQSKTTIKIMFPPESSIFTGECYGIFKALKLVLSKKLKKSIIFTDSLSALQALQKYPLKNKLIFPIIIEIRSLLYECEQLGLSVSFGWIPGHSGIFGNDIADQLANEAVKDGDSNSYKNYYHDLASLPASFLRQSWTDLWIQSSLIKGKYFSCIQPTIPLKPWFFKMKFNKKETSSLIRMRLGHVYPSPPFQISYY
ncbi:unnamed protein product [Pieris macdunnoughi]|uniref:ribonuclease H n=1 Tax=Pieris macdunnoughi TaxID=345717 RepID=A0A821NHJ0_9NEOP|nr:unnamed protein product [Pieris macdunnoughi]